MQDVGWGALGRRNCWRGQTPLLTTPNWLTHLEYDWQTPLNQPLFQRLSRDRQLVRYDARGTGCPIGRRRKFLSRLLSGTSRLSSMRSG